MTRASKKEFKPSLTICPMHKLRLIVSHDGECIMRPCPECEKLFFTVVIYDAKTKKVIKEFGQVGRN